MDKRVTGIPRVKAWKTNSDQHMAALDEWSIGPYKVLKIVLSYVEKCDLYSNKKLFLRHYL